MSFNNVGEDNGESLVNDRTKHPPCRRCGRTNHIVDKYYAKKHDDGTMVHSVEYIGEVEHEINNEVSTEMTTKNGEMFFHGDALMFVQSNSSSLMNQSNTSSKTIRIPNTWILIYSQSTMEVFCNGELRTQIHETNITIRTRCNTGMNTKIMMGTPAGIRMGMVIS